jgi:hypothetical protein
MQILFWSSSEAILPSSTFLRQRDCRPSADFVASKAHDSHPPSYCNFFKGSEAGHNLRRIVATVRHELWLVLRAQRTVGPDHRRAAAAHTCLFAHGGLRVTSRNYEQHSVPDRRLHQGIGRRHGEPSLGTGPSRCRGRFRRAKRRARKAARPKALAAAKPGVVPASPT